MIFVTLGTQDKSFVRLLENLDKIIEKNKIKDEVIVQAGYTNYASKNMKIFNTIPKDEFIKYIKKCDLIITHGGVGSIFDGLKNNKKVIAVPRLSKYKEHTNDHQLEVVDEMAKEGYIIGIFDMNDLEDAIAKSKNWQPKKYKSNNKNMINLLEDYIDNNDRRRIFFKKKRGKI